MEAILAGVACAVCFAAGVVVGIWIDRKLTELYRQLALATAARHADQVRRDALAEIQRLQAKKREIEESGVSLNADEREVSFEESLERIYGADDAAKEKARHDREKPYP